MKQKIEREIRLMGVVPTDSQINKIIEIVQEHKEKRIFNTLNEHKTAQALVLSMVLASATNEILNIPLNFSELKHRFKQKFKISYNHTERMVKEFEKENKENKELMDVYHLLQEDVSEMFYNLFDRLPEK